MDLGIINSVLVGLVGVIFVQTLDNQLDFGSHSRIIHNHTTLYIWVKNMQKTKTDLIRKGKKIAHVVFLKLLTHLMALQPRAIIFALPVPEIEIHSQESYKILETTRRILQPLRKSVVIEPFARSIMILLVWILKHARVLNNAIQKASVSAYPKMRKNGFISILITNFFKKSVHSTPKRRVMSMETKGVAPTVTTTCNL